MLSRALCIPEHFACVCGRALQCVRRCAFAFGHTSSQLCAMPLLQIRTFWAVLTNALIPHTCRSRTSGALRRRLRRPQRRLRPAAVRPALWRLWRLPGLCRGPLAHPGVRGLPAIWRTVQPQRLRPASPCPGQRSGLWGPLRRLRPAGPLWQPARGWLRGVWGRWAAGPGAPPAEHARGWQRVAGAEGWGGQALLLQHADGGEPVGEACRDGLRQPAVGSQQQQRAASSRAELQRSGPQPLPHMRVTAVPDACCCGLPGLDG